MTPAPHGYELDSALHTQLRTRPPVDALRWVERETGSRIASVSALVGGISAAVHRLDLQSGRTVVLRRYVLDWVAEEPWAPGNEATVLRLLAGAEGVPAPDLIAADPDGWETGTPAVLMSALPGEVVWDPDDLHAWLDRLVEVLMRIPRVPPSEDLRPWAPYEPAPGLVPPPWTGNRSAWEQAIEAYHGPRPVRPAVFLHRDFHPGNVLWVGGQVTGVVDWTSSCVGPAEEDVAHCRLNLALRHGQAVADDFLRRWLAAAGRTDWDPYFDLVDLVSIASAEPNASLDAFVAAAARR